MNAADFQLSAFLRRCCLQADLLNPSDTQKNQNLFAVLTRFSLIVVWVTVMFEMCENIETMTASCRGWFASWGSGWQPIQPISVSFPF